MQIICDFNYIYVRKNKKSQGLEVNLLTSSWYSLVWYSPKYLLKAE